MTTPRQIDERAIVRDRGLDPDEWAASKIQFREWDAVTSQGVIPARHLRATLTRRVGPALLASVAAKLRAFGKGPRKVDVVAKGGGLLEVSLNDLHVGAWENGPIEDYARVVWSTAASLIMRGLAQGGIDRVLLVLNGDILHADSVRGETTKGTRLEDVAVPYETMFEETLGVIFGLVNWIAPQRPVDLLVLPGNHDFHALFAVGQALKSAYQDNPRVEVDVSTAKFRYRRWGTVLLGFAHGDTGKLGDLPGLMATDRAKDWGETTHHEWHTGHLHAQAQLERQGCRIRVLPALTKRNEWGKNQGHSTSLRGCEAYVWHEERGYVGHLSEPAAPARGAA